MATRDENGMTHEDARRAMRAASVRVERITGDETAEEIDAAYDALSEAGRAHQRLMGASLADAIRAAARRRNT